MQEQVSVLLGLEGFTVTSVVERGTSSRSSSSRERAAVRAAGGRVATIRASHGLSSRRGIPASVLTEYHEHDIDHLLTGNNDRAAGYARLLELIHPDPRRPFPSWHPRSGDYGSPRLFVFKSCEQVIAQLQSAPIAKDGSEAGEAVDSKWEGAHGHAHAMLRYGVLSRPAPSVMPDPEPTDWRTLEMRRLLAKYDADMEDVVGWRSRNLVDV